MFLMVIISHVHLHHSLNAKKLAIRIKVLAREGHGFAVDWWGLGALLFEMLTGLPPWYSRDRQKMFSSIRNEPLVIPSYVAAEIQTLISGLLEKDPKRRLGGQGGDAAEIKAHSIFRYVGWDQLYQKRVIPPWKPGDKPGGNQALPLQVIPTGMWPSAQIHLILKTHLPKCQCRVLGLR